MAGNPRPTGSKPDKLMRDALMLALKREAEDADGKPTTKLAKIAEALVDKAVGGDVAAIKEIGDRVDGKPPQTVIGDSDNPVEVLARIERVIVDNNTPN